MHVAQKIQDWILFDIKHNGYSTKKRVQEHVNINLPPRRSHNTVLGEVFDRRISDICKRHNLTMGTATKELQERFDLDSRIRIIYRNKEEL